MNSILRYVRLSQGKAILNNEIFFNHSSKDFTQFSQQLFSYLGTGYSKYHKMDYLSRLGFLCAELLLSGYRELIAADPYSTGVVLANANASLETDLKYHNTKLDTGPSPSVFLYSLPNIVIGEICIRHGIKGENIFFIDNKYNISRQVEYVDLLLNDSIVKYCVAGWVELFDDRYDGFMYLATRHDPTAYSTLETRTVEHHYKG